MAALPKDEPALVTAGAGAVTSYVLTLLVTHGTLTGTQASSLTQSIAPFVAAAFMVVLGIVTRRFVTPAHKIENALVQRGLLTDQQLEQLEKLVAARGQRLASEYIDKLNQRTAGIADHDLPFNVATGLPNPTPPLVDAISTPPVLAKPEPAAPADPADPADPDVIPDDQLLPEDDEDVSDTGGDIEDTATVPDDDDDDLDEA